MTMNCCNYSGICRLSTILWRNDSITRNFPTDSFSFVWSRRHFSGYKFRRIFFSYNSVVATDKRMNAPVDASATCAFHLLSCSRFRHNTSCVSLFSPFSTTTTNDRISSSRTDVSSFDYSAHDTDESTAASGLKQTVTGPTFHVAKISYSDGSIEFLRNMSLGELLQHCPSVFPRDVLTLNITSRQERSIEYAKLKSASAARRMAGTTDAAIRRSVPVFVARNRQAIVISIGITRAVATVHNVFLFDAHNPAVKELAMDIAKSYQKNYQVSQGLQHDGECAKTLRNEPNELIFLEAVLRDTAASFNRRIRLYEPICESILENVTHQQTGYQPSQGNNCSHQQNGWLHNAKDNIRSALSSSYDISVVQHLVPLKDSLQLFEIQVKQTIDCLNEVLNNDDTMLSLLLTEQDVAQKAGTTIDHIRHEHVELLIGVYARQISHISMETSYLLNRIQSKQELVALTLSSYRNRMVQLNLHLNIAALAIGFSTVIAGFFGMNVIHGYESSPMAFPIIVSGSIMGGIVMSASCLQLINRRSMQKLAIQKVQQLETLTLALSDMPALDYALKNIVERELLPMNRLEFGDALKSSRHSRRVTPAEVDFLFDIFDYVKDGKLTMDDFHGHETYIRLETTTNSKLSKSESVAGATPTTTKTSSSPRDYE